MKNKIIDLLSKLLNKNKRSLNSFLKKVWEIMLRPDMYYLPGQLAFSVILSFVPLISIISAIGSSFGVDVQQISNFLGRIFINIQFDLIIPSIFGQEVSIKYISVIIIMFYIAANGANSVIIASNQIYNIKQNNYFRRRAKAIIMTLMLCILYIFVLLVPLLGQKIISSFDYFDLKHTIKPIITIIRGPITWIVIYLFIKSIYVIAPDKEIPHRGINLGALFTTVFWLIATYIYSGWINNFTKYDVYYGSLSNIAVLMLWLYWLSYIFVLGLCLNVKVEKEPLEKNGIISKEK